MDVQDNISHPDFKVEQIKPQAVAGESWFRVRLAKYDQSYFISVSSTVLAVWQGIEKADPSSVASKLSDKLNVLHGTAVPFKDNYRFTEANTLVGDGPKIMNLDEVLQNLNVGGDPSPYIDQDPKRYE